MSRWDQNTFERSLEDVGHALNSARMCKRGAVAFLYLFCIEPPKCRSGRVGTLSKLLVTHFGRPLEANVPRLISFKGLYKFFLQAEHARARPQYKGEILSAFFADTALSEYRRRSVAVRSVGIGRRHLLTCTNSQTRRLREKGKASECICMWGRLRLGLQNVPETAQACAALNHLRFDNGRLSRDNRGGN